ncbi:TnsA-like heteromeric transposase endonuclease subunit [Cellulomonas xiejunii]|uniref:TnsA-like heteromeric transposase endonuclease subunit n=1 Tax=Cellulomonas xiejunii TaxID=2968083 RepID=A0ABY5KU57_9CELL|nr:TnsA-like heteromeric transposase endonuclease subunit [Cellulomonas xiejunii]MCC2321270.1 TnsA-like heteromeric transposase endonuclease subunit [Cellulomonas xiejunii]UUI71858.1 TnsA-like heteromeric transposase endonuclease subunit [Cellulomonas xiejunii]
MAATWRFRQNRGGYGLWDWGLGTPPIRDLISVRRPAADAMSRHAPVRMWSATTGDYIVLESGLEYELARSLDRDPSVAWLVAQPVAFTFDDSAVHVPDLLVEHWDGRVVVWDVRPQERQDERFHRMVELTAQACREVGWGSEVHTGFAPARRLNLLWLGVFRAPPNWPHAENRRQLLALAGGGTTVADVLAHDAGDGHLTALVWHLIWTGELVVDLDHAISAVTVLTLAKAETDV